VTRLEQIVKGLLKEGKCTNKEAHTLVAAMFFTRDQMGKHPIMWEKFKTAYGTEAVSGMLIMNKEV